MIRHCDGTDERLRAERTSRSEPCTCGLTFNDTTRSVVYPHEFIPTREDVEHLRAMLGAVALEGAR